MKRISNMFLAVAMVMGSFGSAGCSKPAVQPEAAPIAQESQTDAPAKTDEASVVMVSTTVQLPAPPALQRENPGRAPSTHHVFQRGFWRWDAPQRGYVWVPGHWEETSVFAPTAPPPPRFEDASRAPSAAYFFVPGYWRYTGSEFVWVYGHWSLRADVGSYYRSDYRYANGRWEHQVNRWDDRRMAEHERAERERAERDRAAREQAERERAERARAERERAERDHAAAQQHDDRSHDVQGVGSHDQAGVKGGHEQPKGNGGHDKVDDQPAGKGGHATKPGDGRPAVGAATSRKVAVVTSTVTVAKPTSPRPMTLPSAKGSSSRARG